MRGLLCFALFLLVALQLDAFESKVQKNVKKVAKRFWEESWEHYVSSVPNLLQYMFRSNEYQKDAREHSANVISQHILRQSSKENTRWNESAYILSMLMTTVFEGGICGDTKLNSYQMTSYWNKQRERYTRNEDEKPYIKLINGKPKGNNFELNNFLLEYPVTSTDGITANKTLLVSTRIMNFNDWSNFSIDSIEEVGPCLDHGPADFLIQGNAWIDLVGKGETEGEAERKEMMRKMTEMFESGIEETRIPFRWDKIIEADEYLDASVCLNNAPERYKKMELIRWWLRFQVMWHFPAEEPQKAFLQLLGGEKNRFVYRATIKAQIGTDPNKPVKEWNIKFQLKHINRDTPEWRINNIEIMCPPVEETELQKMHVEALQEIIAKKITTIQEDPDMWYYNINVFEDLVDRGGIEVINCVGKDGQTETKSNLLAIEYKFWFENRESRGKLQGFYFTNEVPQIGDKTEMTLFVKWTESGDYFSKWVFNFHWDLRMQSYSMYKMTMGCPRKHGAQADLSNAMCKVLNVPCRTKSE